MYILFATVKVFFAVLPRHRSGLGIRLLSGSVTVTARSMYHQATTTICMCVIVAIDLSRVHAT